MSAAAKHPPARMTLAEFVAWDAGDPSGRAWQLVDGEPLAMAPASEAHGAVQSELGALLRNHLVAAGMPCRVVTAPGIVPRLGARANFRIPDLGVTCAPPGGGLMLPEPVLLIEILSPNNEAETRANVWTYATIPSVREILLLHGTRVGAELLRRGADGTWPDLPEALGPADTLRLDSIGFAAPLVSAYRTAGLPSLPG